MNSIVCAIFGPVYKKVHFLNSDAAIDGYGILAESGGGENFGNDTYGVFSESQITLLKRNQIPFEIVE